MWLGAPESWRPGLCRWPRSWHCLFSIPLGASATRKDTGGDTDREPQPSCDGRCLAWLTQRGEETALRPCLVAQRPRLPAARPLTKGSPRAPGPNPMPSFPAQAELRPGGCHSVSSGALAEHRRRRLRPHGRGAMPAGARERERPSLAPRTRWCSWACGGATPAPASFCTGLPSGAPIARTPVIQDAHRGGTLFPNGVASWAPGEDAARERKAGTPLTQSQGRLASVSCLPVFLFPVSTCASLTRIFTAIMPMVAAGLILDDPALQPARRLVPLVGTVCVLGCV